MRRILILAIAALLAPAALSQEKASARPENLVVNGGFEQGPDPGGFKQYHKGDKFPGWVIASGSIDHIGTYFKCAHGRCLDMNGSNSGAIRQSISTEAGKKYKLSFALSANSQCGDPKKVLRVSAGKQAKRFPVTAKPNTSWARRSFEFTADADKTPIEFASVGPDSACGPMLDDVSIVELVEKPDTTPASPPK